MNLALHGIEDVSDSCRVLLIDRNAASLADASRNRTAAQCFSDGIPTPPESNSGAFDDVFSIMDTTRNVTA